MNSSLPNDIPDYYNNYNLVNTSEPDYCFNSVNDSVDNVSYKCQEIASQLEAITKLILAQIILFSLELLFSVIGLVLRFFVERRPISS